MEIEYYKILDRLILDETNVKGIIRNVMNTEKGMLELHFDYEDYKWILNGEDVTTPRLLEEATIPFLEGWYKSQDR